MQAADARCIRSNLGAGEAMRVREPHCAFTYALDDEQHAATAQARGCVLANQPSAPMPFPFCEKQSLPQVPEDGLIEQ